MTVMTTPAQCHLFWSIAMPITYLVTTPQAVVLVTVRPGGCAAVTVPYLHATWIRASWTAVRAWLEAQWGERVHVWSV